MKKRKSDAYQYKIVEISVDPGMLNDFDVRDGLVEYLNLSKPSEQFQELKERLMEELLRIIKEELTERQSEILLLRLQGLTQNQIAKQLGVHQTSIFKSLHGNQTYELDKSKNKRYGGSIKKLKRLCEKDEEIQKILKEIEELRDFIR